MCFTKEFTGFMMALNLFTGLALTARGQKIRRTQIFYVFFIMEVRCWSARGRGGAVRGAENQSWSLFWGWWAVAHATLLRVCFPRAPRLPP